MKKLMVIAIAMMALMMAGPASAIEIPYLDYFGEVVLTTDPDTDETTVTQNTVWVSQVVTSEGTYHSFMDPTDPIIGASVVIESSAYLDVFLGNDTSANSYSFDIEKGGVNIFSADLVGLHKSGDTIGGGNSGYYQGLLENAQVNTDFDSAWVRDVATVLDTLVSGASLDIDFDFLGDPNVDKINVEGKIAPVPEPATLTLLGTGLVGFAAARRRKSKA